MDFESQLALAWLFDLAVVVISTAVACVLLYFVIRMGVFHGLRAHSRWIDNGKDYEPVERFNR